MHKIVTFLESGENYARVLKWVNVALWAIAVYMLGVLTIGF